MKRFYLTSGLKNARAAEELVFQLRALGFEQTYNWLVHGSVKSEGPTRMREVSARGIEGIERADFIVVLLPGGRGSHVELGAALGLGKPVFLVAENERLLRGADSGEECAFHWHPQVTRVVGAGAGDFLLDILRRGAIGEPKQLELAL